MDRRHFLVAGGTAVTLALAGCSGDGDDGDSSDGDDGEQFDESVLDSLLSASEIDGWEAVQTRETDLQSPNLIGGRVLELVASDEEAALQVGLAVFETAEDASGFLDDQATEYEQQFGATTQEEDLGDDAQSVLIESQGAVEVRVSNLIVQVIGAETLTNLKGIAERQLNAVQG
jgi:hypothetical protein